MTAVMILAKKKDDACREVCVELLSSVRCEYTNIPASHESDHAMTPV